MSHERRAIGHADGTVIVQTGVEGRAARTGHRLTIEFDDWSGQVTTVDDEPTALAATIVVDSLRVRSGAGGLTPLTGPEKAAARSNAVKSLRAWQHPQITYESSSISAAAGGYRVEGVLTINGHTRPHALDIDVTSADGQRHATATTTVHHRDFGLTPFSLMLGALRVADAVRVDISVTIA